MKIKYFLLVLVVFSSISCTELENDSYGSVVSEKYVPITNTEVSALINAAYIPWRKTMLLWNGVVRAQELCADQDVVPARIGTGWIDGYVYKRMHQHSWTTDDDGVLQPWSRTFDGINTCNRVIYQIESEIINVDEKTKTELLAELKVLRASYYYILVDLFGNVPIVTDYKSTELPDQSSRVEVFNFIISEVKNNLDNLSDAPRDDYYGRINKWVANTILAKMYLNAEVWIGEPMWIECIDACDKVIESGYYDLETEQKNVFVTNNQNSQEIIFALPFDEVYVTDWNAFDFHMYTLASENQQTYKFTNTPWGGVCEIPQFIDTYDSEDTRLKENFIYGQQYSYEGEPLDLNYINEVPSIDESYKNNGFRWGKFEYAIGSSNRLSNDFPVFRYADILMMKAESLMRSGQPGAGTLVSKIRERAFKDNPEKAIVTDEELIQGSSYDYGRRDTYSTTHEGGADIIFGRFLDELGWEFTQEGRRRQDLIRFGVFTTKSWFSHDASNDVNLQIYPIPYSVMLTNSNLKQNLGY